MLKRSQIQQGMFGFSAERLVEEALKLAATLSPEHIGREGSKAPAAIVTPGLKEKRRGGFGTQFWQYRPYHATDTSRAIDWKRSARSDAVIVREREQEQSDIYRFWIDPAAQMSAPREPMVLPTKSYSAAIVALALSHLLHEEEDRTGLFSFERERSARGTKALEGHAATFLHHDMPPLKVLSSLPQSKTERPILFSDFWLPLDELERYLKPMLENYHSGLLVQVTYSDEVQFPFVGRTVFENTGTDNDETHDIRIEDAAAIRHVYLERIKAHQEGLATLAAKNGWSFVSFSASDDLPPVIARLYEDAHKINALQSPQGRYFE
ncbi:MAG: DUF58 domain-containing protein [Pseudobdellovibrionaceae bacterium]